jgi:hypothetical protein
MGLHNLLQKLVKNSVAQNAVLFVIESGNSLCGNKKKFCGEIPHNMHPLMVEPLLSHFVRILFSLTYASSRVFGKAFFSSRVESSLRTQQQGHCFLQQQQQQQKWNFQNERYQNDI